MGWVRMGGEGGTRLSRMCQHTGSQLGGQREASTGQRMAVMGKCAGRGI
jgi:hypothetical protein